MPDSYTVKPGDTLAAIARREGVTLAALLDANPAVTNPNRVGVGQVLTLPGAQAPPTPTPGRTVSIVTRSEWGAKPPRKPAGPLGAVKGVTVHHTAQGYSYAAQPGCSPDDGERALRAVQASHFARRFSDVGYHFVIDGAGRIYQGRDYRTGGSFAPGAMPPQLALGSHVAGHNTGRIGVCLLGCFGAAGERGCDDRPSPAALDALERLLVALCAAYGAPPAQIKAHRDFASTACPGTHLYKLLPAIRGRVAAGLG